MTNGTCPFADVLPVRQKHRTTQTQYTVASLHEAREPFDGCRAMAQHQTAFAVPFGLHARPMRAAELLSLLLGEKGRHTVFHSTLVA